MSLTFCNHYSFTPGHYVWVAFMWYDPNDCGGDHFNEIGWYRIDPGGCTTVFNSSVNFNRNWYYYAESTDGATWNGDIQGWVSDSAFRLCHGEQCTPCRVVGFRLLDVNNYDDYTLTLTA
jgi:uncharacterized membrane protein